MSESARSAVEESARSGETTRIGHFIGGEEVQGASGRVGEVFNPATGKQVGVVDFADASEVDRAVAAAKAAFPRWRALSLARRSELMFGIRDALQERRDEIARLITREHGKTFRDALGETARGLEVVDVCCGIPELLKGEFSEQASTNTDVYSIRQPLGVVAGVSPFNFPVMVPMWMWATALACGNTFVLKPSEKDPSASLYIADVLNEVGVPPGVFNVVQGDVVAVDRLLEHPDVMAISSVGSTLTARHIYEQAGRYGKRVQALGGAKNHMVVLPDADIDQASAAAVSAAYGSAGERCMAVSVVVAVGDVADSLVDKIRAGLAEIVVGDGADPDSQMGPLVTLEHRDRVASHIDRARAQGATVTVDGREATSRANDKGFFLGPSLLDDVTPEMDCYREEIFGPVLSIVRVDDLDDAVRLINENPYGNGAALFTRDGAAARRFRYEVEAGMVGINVPIPVPVGYYSFGGWNGSLFGDRGIYGKEGVEFYTRPKVVTSRWPGQAAQPSPGLDFPRTGA